MVGIALFGVAGVGDMAWHEVFGIEANVEALLSPTHLLVIVGAGLFVSGLSVAPGIASIRMRTAGRPSYRWCSRPRLGCRCSRSRRCTLTRS